MLNSCNSGGLIYVGRDDDGKPYPLPDIDGTLTQITNSIRDSILPDVTIFVGYEADENGIAITVQEGTQIREMIKLTDGDKFEAARSLTQELTFNAAVEEFSRCDVEFGENQMRTLGIIGSDGLYTI